VIISQKAPNLLEQAWQTNKSLTVLLLICIATMTLSFLGLFVDPRLTEILNTPTWTKTFKFSVSFAVYAATLLWVLPLLEPRFQKNAGIAASVVSITGLIEVILIVIQGFRAVPMHFNESTPFDTLLWQIMSSTIGILLLSYIALMVIAWRGIKTNTVLAWGVRLGFAVTLIGLLQGFFMTGPTSVQKKAMDAGQTVSIIGAHTVGSSSLTPDNGAGLPLLGWNTTTGDLRIGHFIGLHALQLLPFLALWLSRRRERWLTDKHRNNLLSMAALGYLGLVVLLTWQALRGQSIVAPDITTLTAFLGLVGTVALLSFGVLAHAQAKKI
jgi:hypothetical protein